MRAISNESISELKVISTIIVFSLSLYLGLMTPGLVSTDENANLYLSKSIAESFSLQVDSYFKGRDINEQMALPPSFSINEEHVYADVDIGYPLTSSPFYRLFGGIGLQISNAIITSLTLVFLYYGSLKIWGNREAGFLSVLIYLFGTYSLFHSTSLWHHALVTMSFLGAQVSWLYFDEDAKKRGLFLLTSVIAVLTASYMLIPIGTLFLYVLKKKRNGIIVPIFLATLLAILWYNLQVSPSVMGKQAQDFGFSFSTAIHNFISMVIYRGYIIDPWGRWSIQKSILESSPFLITSFFGLFYLKKKSLIVPNFIYLLGILLYTPPDFGGWTLNMRYLLPILPFMTLLSAGFISRFYRNSNLLVLPLLVLTGYSYIHSPKVAIGSFEYLELKILSLSSAIALFISSLMYIHMKSRVTFFTLVLMFLGSLAFSNFLNVHELQVGNLKRSYHISNSNTLKALTSEGDVIILPKFSPWDRTVIDDRVMFYYPNPTAVRDDRDIAINDLIEKSVARKKSIHLVFWVDDEEIKRLALNLNGNVSKIDNYYYVITSANP